MSDLVESLLALVSGRLALLHLLVLCAWSSAHANQCDPTSADSPNHTALLPLLTWNPPTGLDAETVLNLKAADVTGDGFEDVVVTSFFDYRDVFSPRVLVNDQVGGFTDGSASLFASEIPDVSIGRQVLIGKLNADEQNDILIVDTGLEIGDPWPGSTLKLLLSNPDGTLSDASGNLPTVVAFHHGGSFGDIDADGDLDIFVNALGPIGDDPRFQLLINDGNGRFVSGRDRVEHICAEQDCDDWQHYWSQLLDANGDGYADLYLSGGGANGGESAFVLNLGNGYFGEPVVGALPASQFPGGVPESTAVMDINGDGNQDLLLAESRFDGSLSSLRLWMSQGDGRFLDETDSRMPGNAETPPISAPIDLRDLNGDGHLDILTYINFTEIGFWLNDGNGQFQRLPQDFVCLGLFKTAIDVDNDDSVDFVHQGRVWGEFEIIRQISTYQEETTPPTVSILGGDKNFVDTNGIAGESVSLSATATGRYGSVKNTEWLINGSEVAAGLVLNITLPDGDTQVTFRATDFDGSFSTVITTVIVEAPPLAAGWPSPYSGVTPDESLALGLNNISAFNPEDGLIYACINVLYGGVPDAFEGFFNYDIAFEVVSLEAAVIGVNKVKPFNETNALNENGEYPDCSGSIDLVTGVYADIIQVNDVVFGIQFDLTDGEKLHFTASSLEVLSGQ